MAGSVAFADAMDAYYERYDIYKCLLICTDDTELCHLVKELQTRNHSVLVHDTDTQNIQAFEDINYRIFATTFSLCMSEKDAIERYILPEQNLVATTLNDNISRDIYSWVGDAQRRGFRAKTLETHFLNLEHFLE